MFLLFSIFLFPCQIKKANIPWQYTSLANIPLKTHTHRPIFRGFVVESAVESADSIPESANYTTNSVIVGRLPLSSMFDIVNPLELADGNRPTGNWPSGCLKGHGALSNLRKGHVTVFFKGRGPS